MKSKMVLAVITLICTITIGVGATLAYFISHSGPVTNTFTVGEVEITLTETLGRTTPLIPGTTVKKDPTVTVKGGSEECHLFVRLEHDGDHEAHVFYAIAEGWSPLPSFPGVYYRTVEKSESDQLYAVLKDNQVTVDSDLTKEEMAEIHADHGGLVITAYAIQTFGMESVSDGWYKLLNEINKTIGE